MATRFLSRCRGGLVGTRAGLKRYLEGLAGGVEAGKGREFCMESVGVVAGRKDLHQAVSLQRRGCSRRRRRGLGLPGDQRTIRGGAGHGLFSHFISFIISASHVTHDQAFRSIFRFD